jgi:hypothetical protein
MVAGEEAPQCAVAKARTLTCKRAAQFLDRHVTAGLEGAQDRRGMHFDRAAASVSTERPRAQVDELPLQRPPAADAGGTSPLSRMAEITRCRKPSESAFEIPAGLPLRQAA